MSEFSQNGVVATLHDFSNRDLKDLERDLKKFSKDRKMELILPCLYSELEGGALPNIVSEISKTDYLNHIIKIIVVTNSFFHCHEKWCN